MIRDMIISKFENVEIAKVVGCSPNTVRNIRLNLQCLRYENTKAPLNGGEERLAAIAVAVVDCHENSNAVLSSDWIDIRLYSSEQGSQQARLTRLFC